MNNKPIIGIVSKPNIFCDNELFTQQVIYDGVRNAILKKRIKKLGVYNLFFDGYNISYVITYMRGMHWKELDKLMKERGI